MTSTEQIAKRIIDSSKKSPLKVVSPIIRKYSGHRQGKIKKKIKFPRTLRGNRQSPKNKIIPKFKAILPKANIGNIIILEPELLPCALNPQKRKRKEDDNDNVNRAVNDFGNENDGKVFQSCQGKDFCNKQSKKLFTNNKKKIKYLKNVKDSIELLEFNASAFKEKREQAFAENYLLRVQQRFKGKEDNIYNQFLDLICNFQVNGVSVCDLYKEIRTLFACHTDLSEDFIAFLTPDQALECGVFMNHLLLTTMSDFLNLIDIYFAKSPQQIKKIHSVLESIATKPNITSEYVINTILPLLKGNPVLKDYFVQLLPDSRPPDSFLTDYEEVEFIELNSDVSDDEDVMEMNHLPEVDDLYGGDLCPCKCHQQQCGDEQGQHCTPCSLRFINGKVFVQNGKFLRPARIVFDDYDINFHRERLAPKQYPKKNKKKNKHILFKDNLSPTKSSNLSSDEFKSDIEEEDRGKLRLGCVKSPKISRKKSVSPKQCDKAVSRCIFNELKLNQLESENKTDLVKAMPLLEDKEKKLIEFDLNKSEDQCDLTFMPAAVSQELEKEKKDCIPKMFELPMIDAPEIAKSWKKPLSMVSLNESSEEASNTTPKNQLSFEEKEGSRSPPVLSIPETSLTSDSKPILSLLETFDDCSESSSLLYCCNAKKINLENSLNSIQKGTVIPNCESKLIEDNNLPWKIEEDRIILQTLQVEENSEETFLKIGRSIPARSVEEIKERFTVLMNILVEMKTKT